MGDLDVSVVVVPLEGSLHECLRKEAKIKTDGRKRKREIEIYRERESL